MYVYTFIYIYIYMYIYRFIYIFYIEINIDRPARFVHRGAPHDPSPLQYRATSLTRKRTLLGPYRRPMPRVLGGSWGGRSFLWARYPCTAVDRTWHK